MRKTMFLLSCVLLFVCEKPSAEREPLEKTPAGGDAIAQFNLGVNYGTREGLPKDEARAFEWFQKAAAQGSDKARFLVGKMYAQGAGS